MRVLYISSFVTGTAGILIALSLTGVESALDAWWSLASIFSGGFAFRSPLHTNLTIVFGTMTIFFVGLLMTKLLKKEK